jgi:choline dehydrogenase-like flavoprotein
MGTTRLGNGPKKAVVDTNCKVFDMENLYIAGSSIFPTSGGINPTLNALVFSQRLVDYLSNKVKV